MRSEDIARLVGVSRSTVSRVINNYPDVPQATRDKVMKAIQEHNYFPNAAGRKLAGARNNTLGIFLFDLPPDGADMPNALGRHHFLYNNVYYSPLVNAAVDAANQKDYYVLISRICNKNEYSKAKNAFYEKRIDGGIFIGCHDTDWECVGEIIDRKHKVALIDAEPVALGDKPREQYENEAVFILPDNFRGAMLMTEYLLDLGHRRIGVIAGSDNQLSARIRLRGFTDTMEKHHLSIDPSLIVQGDYNEEGGYTCFKRLLGEHPDITAVFAFNDSMAMGAYRGAKEIGLRIPEDISICGFDNTQFSALLQPALTTVDIPLTQIAEHAVSDLVELIENGGSAKKSIPKSRILDVSLVCRQSCRSIS